MKSLAVLMLLSLLAFPSIGQDNGYVALGIGPSIPMGAYASTEEKNEKAGFATTGFLAEISFGYKLVNTIGIGATIRSQMNGFNEKAFTDIFNAIDPTASISMTSESYKSIGFLAGLYGSFPRSDGNSSLDIRGQIGVLRCQTGDLNFNLNYMGSSGTIKFEGTTSSSLAYLIGVGYKLNVGDLICLNIGLDFQRASPEFVHVNPITGESEKFEQDISTFNVTIGVGLRI